MSKVCVSVQGLMVQDLNGQGVRVHVLNVQGMSSVQGLTRLMKVSVGRQFNLTKE